ncbi:MAG: hypothetical protein QNJ72_45710 [Pleurocapsa sp. MO_226.B13]|nr:hypothetical protein [Pleurocapsa sp. MO_226.B13]
MTNTSVRQGAQSASCEPINEQEDLEKNSSLLLQSEGKNNGQESALNESKITRGYKSDESCSDTSIYSVGLGASASQQSNLGEYRQLSLWKSTPTHKQSCDRISQEYQFTQTSETTNQNQESLTSLPVGFPVLAHQTQELEQDLNIQLPLFGEKDLDVLSRLNPASVLSNNLKELSDEDFELFLADSVWQDTVLRLKLSQQQDSEQVTEEGDYSLFPTLTSNVSSTSRPAGQTKCDRWFKDNGLIQPGYQLGAQAIAMIMGFPMDWFDCLSPTEHQEESEQDTSQEEQSPQDKQRSPLEESSTSQKLLGGEKKLLEHKRGERSSLSQRISIPCIVKQPKQPEVKGVIRKDEGDRLRVETNGEKIFVSKLFVYPDFPESVGQIDELLQGGLNKSSSKNTADSHKKVIDTSDKCSSKTTPPSKNCSRKNRRKKGEGSGAIFYRTVTKNGRDYQEAYYHWRENGKQKSKYIPLKLLDQVKQAESRKLPVEDILVLLGCIEKCSRKKSDTSIISTDDKVIDTWDKCSRKKIGAVQKQGILGNKSSLKSAKF